MPKGWTKQPLIEFATLQRGFDITKAEQQDGEYPVFSSSGIGSYHSQPMVEGPGVIIGRKGSLGTAFYSPGPFWPHDTTLWVKDFHGNDPRFVYYVLLGMHFEQYDCGASNATLNRNHVHGLPVHVPPQPIQSRIAEWIGVYDDLIANNTKRIKLLEEMARSLYREWFVNFRFPGHEKTKFINSKLGKHPEGWQWTELGEHFDMLTGFPFKSDKYTQADDDIRLLRGDNIAQGCLRWDGVKRWPQEQAGEHERYELAPGDVVLAMDRPWIDAGLKWASVGKADLPALLVQRVARMRGANGVSTTFVRHIVASESFCAYVKAITTGANVPHISGPDIKKFPFCLPPQPIQEPAVDVLDAWDQMIANCKARNANLRATRDILLPRLVSGEIDVSSLRLETAAS